MFEFEMLVFAGVFLLLLVLPGPAVIYVVAESIESGRRAGLFASLGLTLGNLVHVSAGIVGLSAWVESSALGLGILRYTAAAYFVYLGIRQIRLPWRSRDQGRDPATPRSSAATVSREHLLPWRSLARGILVNVLNLKFALFFLVFFSRFFDPERGSLVLQKAGLALCVCALTLAVTVAYALLAGKAADLARRFWPAHGRLLAQASGFASGLVYIGLGLTALALGGGEGPLGSSPAP